MTAPARSAASRADAGFVAIEVLAAIGLLLLPMFLVVASLPQWADRQHAARVIAREAARVAAVQFPEAGPRSLAGFDRALAEAQGVPPGEVQVAVRSSGARGGVVTATVSVRMPAVVVPFAGGVGEWRYTTTHTERIEDYRSR